MVGRLGMLGLWGALMVLLPIFTQCEDCSKFKKEYCNLQLDKIMMLDTGMENPLECQTACFERQNCTQFTFFSGANKRCVLFSQCSPLAQGGNLRGRGKKSRQTKERLSDQTFEEE